MKNITILLFFLFTFLACEEKTYIYEVNDLEISQNNADKNKAKSQEQFINIAYANLYQAALSPNNLVNVSNVITSIGDKQIAYETVIAKMMADPEVKVPTRAEIMMDLDAFVLETYKRFFVRLPSEAEKAWWKNYITSHPNLSPELIYFSFATCDEYNFY